METTGVPETVRELFTPEGGEAYLRDLPDATMIRLSSGHFAVEDSLDEIVSGIKKFYDTAVCIPPADGRT